MKINDYWEMLKFFFTVKREAKKLQEAREAKMNGEKPGYKTTEFWLTILASGITMWQTIQGNVPHPWGEVVLLALTATYNISRAIVKKQ